MLLHETSSPALQFRFLLASRLGRGDPLARLREITASIDELLFAEIADRRSDRGLRDREDILSLLIAARFEDGGAMSDQELRDQLVTLLLTATNHSGLDWPDLRSVAAPPHRAARLSPNVDAGEDAYTRSSVGCCDCARSCRSGTAAASELPGG
jgi:hypothetical protein